MRRTEVEATVGADGILRLEVPFELADAGRNVRIVVEALPPKMTQKEWEAFIDEFAGAWQGDFERPEPGMLEEREPRGTLAPVRREGRK